MQGFIKKYGKEEGAISEEASLSIQGNVDVHTLEATLGEVASQSIGGRLARLLEYCEKNHSGFCLKAVIRKFFYTFNKYYG